MNGVRWAENCLNPQAWRALINGLRPTGSQQQGQPCRSQFCGPCQSASHQWPGRGHRLHANKFADDIKLGDWDSTLNGRASLRRTLLGLRTGPEDTSWGSAEVQRSAPMCWAGTAKQQPHWKAAGTYNGCQAAKEPTARSHCNTGNPIPHYTGGGVERPLSPATQCWWSFTGCLKIVIWIKAPRLILC